jgi:4-hydroxy-tetrahydrodipicolinate synthase
LEGGHETSRRPLPGHQLLPWGVFHCLLEGVIPALVTPFGEDEQIDYDAWQAIIDAQIAAGVDGLLVGGSTGEFCSMSDEERILALRFCCRAAAARVPVYGNIGCISTRAALKLAREAEAEGADCLLAVTPYYFRPSPEELAEHYVEICGATDLPVLAYKIPMFTGVDLPPRVARLIAEKSENFVGLKDSSGDFARIPEYVHAVPGRRLAVFMGNDNVLLPALEAGAAGVMSGGANIAPKLFIDMYRAFREGRREEAVHLQELAIRLEKTYALRTFPAAIKEAMRLVGLPAGPCRRPVGPFSAEARHKLVPVLDRLREENYLPIVRSTVR